MNSKVVCAAFSATLAISTSGCSTRLPGCSSDEVKTSLIGLVKRYVFQNAGAARGVFDFENVEMKFADFRTEGEAGVKSACAVNVDLRLKKKPSDDPDTVYANVMDLNYSVIYTIQLTDDKRIYVQLVKVE